jgi:hypothetical protein
MGSSKIQTTKAAGLMQTTDPTAMFLLVLAIGVIAGFLFDQLAGPSWLARQFSGSTRGIITSALNRCCRCVRWLSRRHTAHARQRNSDLNHCSGDWYCCSAGEWRSNGPRRLLGTSGYRGRLEVAGRGRNVAIDPSQTSATSKISSIQPPRLQSDQIRSRQLRAF